jgi:hypothetical protein
VRLFFGALAALLAAQGAATVNAVRVTTIDFRTAVRVLTSEEVPVATVGREGEEVVIRVPAPPAGALAIPAPEPPIAAIRVEEENGATLVRVTVAPEVPFEASHEPGMMTVVFGETPAPDLRGPVTPELYAQLFPAGALTNEKAEPAKPERQGETAGGLVVGRVTLRPYVSASYVDADVLAFDEVAPVRERYLQVAPGVTATAPVFGGQFAAEYEARLRFFASLPQVEKTSHLAGVRLELPLGSRGTVRVSDRFTRAVLETTVVDPGQEYYYDLSPFTFNETLVGAHVDVGARTFVEGDLGWRWSRFDPGATGFFGYTARTAGAGLGYDLGGNLRVLLSYLYEHIPPAPDRSIAESRAHNLAGTLSGSIGPLTQGTVSAGFRSQTNPLATGASASYRGLTLGGTLTRQLGHSSRADLALRRATEPSFFEENAYYVTNQAGLALTVPAPFETWARGSVNWLRNDYPNDTPSIAEPRRDRILGWTVGVGRAIGWRAWVRADYHREKRISNLPGYDVTTSGFIVQLGVGQGAPGAARP